MTKDQHETNPTGLAGEQAPSGSGGKLLELDERRRTSLGKIGRQQDRRYLVTELPDGTVILRPAVVLSEAELRLLSDPDRLARVDAALADPESAVPWTPRTPGRPARAS